MSKTNKEIHDDVMAAFNQDPNMSTSKAVWDALVIAFANRETAAPVPESGFDPLDGFDIIEFKDIEENNFFIKYDDFSFCQKFDDENYNLICYADEFVCDKSNEDGARQDLEVIEVTDPVSVLQYYLNRIKSK